MYTGKYVSYRSTMVVKGKKYFPESTGVSNFNVKHASIQRVGYIPRNVLVQNAFA